MSLHALRFMLRRCYSALRWQDHRAVLYHSLHVILKGESSAAVFAKVYNNKHLAMHDYHIISSERGTAYIYLYVYARRGLYRLSRVV
jgi:hypothetical protein